MSDHGFYERRPGVQLQQSVITNESWKSVDALNQNKWQQENKYLRWNSNYISKYILKNNIFLNMYPTCTFNKHYFLNSPQKRTICWLQTIHVSYSSVTPFVYAFWGTTFQLTVKWFLPNDLYFYSIKSAGFDSFPAHKGK